MENEFLISEITEKCQVFDITKRGYAFKQKLVGAASVTVLLESAGAYDIDMINAAFRAGKKVKLVICE